MGGKTPAKQPRQGAVKDAGRGPERVVGGILDGPPARLFCRRFTAHSTSASEGTPYSTSNGSIVTGMVSPGGVTRLYILLIDMSVLPLILFSPRLQVGRLSHNIDWSCAYKWREIPIWPVVCINILVRVQ